VFSCATPNVKSSLAIGSFAFAFIPFWSYSLSYLSLEDKNDGGLYFPGKNGNVFQKQLAVICHCHHHSFISWGCEDVL
jgi:hypothetical protein